MGDTEQISSDIDSSSLEKDLAEAHDDQLGKEDSEEPTEAHNDQLGKEDSEEQAEAQTEDSKAENTESGNEFENPPSSPSDDILLLDQEAESDVTGDEEVEIRTASFVHNRIELIEKHQKLLQERKELKNINRTLQAKLAFYFKSKKIDIPSQEKTASELEEEYRESLRRFDGFQNQVKNFKDQSEREIEELQKEHEKKENKVKEAYDEFEELEKTVAMISVDSSSGLLMTLEETQQYVQKLKEKDNMLRKIRLECIKNKNLLEKAEKQQMSMNKLSSAVNFVEFEQLGAEIETFYMKIGHREEEIVKLQKRCSNTINILGHFKEKLYSTEKRKKKTEERLKYLEDYIKGMRNQLFELKTEHEKIKAESHELQQKFKLLQNESLFQDYESAMQADKALTDELESLKKKYHSAMECINASTH